MNDLKLIKKLFIPIRKEEIRCEKSSFKKSTSFGEDPERRETRKVRLQKIHSYL